MGNILSDSWDTYKENLRLIVLFSIAFVLAFAIPLFAPLPTYEAAGAIFLRNASIFVNGNINAANLVIITLSSFFSLLFLSFAFVAISLIVKARKTHLKISNRAFNDIEKYVGKVFILYVAATFIVLIVNIVGYVSGGSSLTLLIELVVFTMIFYAPAAIVIDNKGIVRAVKESISLLVSSPLYYLAWLVLLVIVISVLDLIVILIAGTAYSGPVMLILNSLFVLPYFVIFNVEAYIRRFALLSH